VQNGKKNTDSAVDGFGGILEQLLGLGRGQSTCLVTATIRNGAF
jgi:hypothetical protein